MITLKNNSKYAGLFQKAWNELYYRGQFDGELDAGDDANELKYYKEQGNTFNTLEDYFTKIQDLITVERDAKYPPQIKSCGENGKIELINNPKAGQQIKVNYEFIMLPLDEPRFSIDANTRDITIPANFRKLVGVEGDHVAETLIFDIDRYFDFVDLYHDQMNIWVQWDDEKDATHASEIIMKYYDPIAKKIVFGWSLDQNITKKARTISFSIRIFMKEGDDVVYNFNTKPHTITIVRALHPDLMDLQVDTDSSKSFLNAIKNSTSADAHASTPTFEAPGLNLSTEIHDLEQIESGDENYYYLDVQAITADQGVLEYGSWKYKADGTIVVNPKDGEIVYKAVEYNSAKQNKTVYYIVNAENPLSYIKAENPDTTDETLYERYWRYKIAKDTPAAGSYWTSVRHRNGKALSEEIFTNTLTLAGPGEISFGDGPLDKDCFINKPLDFKINKTKETKIKTLEWEYSADGTTFILDSSLGSIGSDDEAIWLTATQPGWYKATITGVRNNTSTDRIEMPKIYRIVAEPQAVTNIRVTGDYNSDTSDVVWQNGISTITVEHDFFEKPELQSDTITYQWYILPANSTGSNVKINAENAEEYGIDSNTVTSSSLKFKKNVDGAFKFFCTITNTLNGKSASANTADILAY